MKKTFGFNPVSYLFIAPPLILFSVFVLVPVIASFLLSFTDFNVLQAPKFVGLNNYKELIFHDSRFWHAIRNTAIYVSVVVPVGLCISLFLAVLVDQKIKFKNLFKTLYFMPTVTSVCAIAVIWMWLLAGEKYGLVNHFLLFLGIQPIEWLMSVKWTLPSIMVMSIWTGIGYNMILFLAGLQSIPNFLYEAAEIDGAGTWHKFWHVTLPLLRPILVYVVIISTINSFQVFDEVYVITGGKGGIGGVLDSALTVVAYLYDTAFQKFKMGYASSIAYILFGVIFLLTILNLKFIKPRTEY